jgi:hypothetical protein
MIRDFLLKGIPVIRAIGIRKPAVLVVYLTIITSFVGGAVYIDNFASEWKQRCSSENPLAFLYKDICSH